MRWVGCRRRMVVCARIDMVYTETVCLGVCSELSRLRLHLRLRLGVVERIGAMALEDSTLEECIGVFERDAEPVSCAGLRYHAADRRVDQVPFIVVRVRQPRLLVRLVLPHAKSKPARASLPWREHLARLLSDHVGHLARWSARHRARTNVQERNHRNCGTSHSAN